VLKARWNVRLLRSISVLGLLLNAGAQSRRTEENTRKAIENKDGIGRKERRVKNRREGKRMLRIESDGKTRKE